MRYAVSRLGGGRSLGGDLEGREGRDLLPAEAPSAVLDLLLLGGDEELVLDGRDELGLLLPAEELAAGGKGEARSAPSSERNGVKTSDSLGVVGREVSRKDLEALAVVGDLVPVAGDVVVVHGHVGKGALEDFGVDLGAHGLLERLVFLPRLDGVGLEEDRSLVDGAHLQGG